MGTCLYKIKYKKKHNFVNVYFILYGAGATSLGTWRSGLQIRGLGVWATDETSGQGQ